MVIKIETGVVGWFSLMVLFPTSWFMIFLRNNGTQNHPTTPIHFRVFSWAWSFLWYVLFYLRTQCAHATHQNKMSLMWRRNHWKITISATQWVYVFKNEEGVFKPIGLLVSYLIIPCLVSVQGISSSRWCGIPCYIVCTDEGGRHNSWRYVVLFTWCLDFDYFI